MVKILCALRGGTHVAPSQSRGLQSDIQGSMQSFVFKVKNIYLYLAGVFSYRICLLALLTKFLTAHLIIQK